MKILVTGAKGFIGRNLIAHLKNVENIDIMEYDTDSDISNLEGYCKEAEFVFHLAGVNRPKDQTEFMGGNFGFTSTLLVYLNKYNNHCPIMISSSTQAELDNPYGKSKKAGEHLVFKYQRETGAKVLVYRFPNVFGKWCRPNYNSAVATFCYNISRDLPITINDPDTVLNLVYIDDVIDELMQALEGNENMIGKYCEIPIVYRVTLGKIAELLNSFKKIREDNFVPDLSNSFIKKLYSTYLSYLPEEQFSYEPFVFEDSRGTFTEFIKSNVSGQVSINISKPGITKGNHWHHTKNEKFIVVSGTGVIRFRKIGTEQVIEYFVSGDKMEIVDVPCGYTHNIENLGDTDLITIIWANECFDTNRPDTYYLEV
ncbi:capsular polysaccharide biosynthesis protein CapF [Anaerosacchariphilus polymeriproducens]|uniref:NAD-dependent epimerase/dehydratase family protein n=1 Tax=Anaerosacchariphilus polymeriproducens TaxID=1812858 RepID=A0A371AQY6_9FIRM|nr:capsular polysaccharide biosynthesis protein CapF [Anaerosacchariphilus polymeriproducens]RDU21997.1 NAD-dependent epimerase/dehydratase family protein [Anaerosacchariphilus polymeriproducens]